MCGNDIALIISEPLEALLSLRLQLGEFYNAVDNFYICFAGKKSHKGGGKQFSNPEEIDRQMKAQRELVGERPHVVYVQTGGQCDGHLC